MGVPPAECLVIEDTITGVASGMAAGMSVVATSNDLTDVALRTDTELDQQWIVHEPENLQSVVNHLIEQQK